MQPKFGTIARIYLLTVLSWQMVRLSSAANIVFFFGVSTYSHRRPAWPLAEALAERGHNVTFISPNPDKNPNPKIFDYVPRTLKEWVDSWGETDNVFEKRKNGDWITNWLVLPDLGIIMCEILYNDQEYINWMKSSKVDLVILDTLANDCSYGMAHYWGAKTILFSTSAPFPYFTESFGLPDETNWIPSIEFAFPFEMSFTQRLTNALLPVAWQYLRKWKFFPKLEEITREKLGINDLPRFEKIHQNTSLVFLNNHYAEEFARALPPNTIPIGGIVYKEERNALPKELETFLKKADGFVYFSFGTYGDFLQLDKSHQQAFIGAMQSLPHIHFVWKVGNESFAKEFPNNNVFISNWMPQQDILAHPKCRAFITHAGLLGIQEAIYNAVPLISFPIFADQDYNAERIHRKGYGIRLEITTITQSQLVDAIRTVLTDPKYRDNMNRVSILFKERPQKPLDTALWWTDFVLRHSQEDLTSLRPSNVGQPWWKRRQLDVWTTIIVSVVTLLLSLIFSIYKLLKCICSRNRSSSPNVNNRLKKLQ